MQHGKYDPILFVLAAVFSFIAAHTGVRRWKTAGLTRSMELKDLAKRLGFAGFDETLNQDFVAGWSFLTRLSEGENRYAFNILEGTYQNQKLFVFDYHFQLETGSRRDDDHRYYTILMLIVPEAFPKLTLRPQDLLGRMEGVLDGEDIKFESIDFSKIYHVRCADKKFAYDVCNPQMIEYLLSNTGLEIEIQGPVISLAFTPQVPVSEIEVNLQRIAQIRALLPDYLFQET